MLTTGRNHTIINDLTAWVDAFLVDRQAANLSPNTVRFYRCHLGKFIEYCQNQQVYKVVDITPGIMRTFLLWLESEGHNPGGMHVHYRAVKAFIRWWVDETEPHDYTDIFRKVDAPKVTRNPLPPVPFDDLRAMLQTCGKDWHGLRDAALLLCLLDTGARAAEFLSLNVEDTNMRTGAVYIEYGKGGKSRTVFIGKAARRALRRYLGTRRSGPLWIKTDTDRLTYWGLRQVLRRRAGKAGTDTPSPHGFRRAFAVNSLRAGMDLETLRRLMGHSDYQVLQRYLTLINDDLRAAHARTSPADRLNKRR